MWELTKDFLIIYKKIFIKMLGLVISAGDLFLSFPLGIIYSMKSRKTVPQTTNHILLTPATVLAKQIREQTLSSEMIMRTYIDRIKQVNPIVNAVVEENFNRALKEAIEADLLVFSGLYRVKEIKEKFPLLGVPITIKESIAVNGMSNKAGLICNRKKPRNDAEVVKRLRIAGAIVIAVTNTPELCLNWECMNKITGKTSNPYDTRRTCGGSSGGEAALISSAASVIGCGSDTLGSLRLPAHFCGIFSHKPTSGIVSVDGHFPDAEERSMWEKVFTLGPMARYAVDLPLLLSIIVKDEHLKDLNLEKKVNFSELTIFYMDRLGDRLTHSVLPEIVQAIHETVKHFNEIHNTKIEKWTLPDIKITAGRSLTSLIAIKGVDDIFNKDAKKSIIMEFIRYFIGKSKHIFSAISYLFLHRYRVPYDIDAIRKRIETSKENISATLGDNGILICPVFPIDAPYHYQMLSKSYNNLYMSVFNSLGFPVTTCPVRCSKKHLPIGLQVVAKKKCDRLTIAVAREIELLFGGWHSSYNKYN